MRADAATRGRILVVEDNRLNRELVVDLLEAEGYTVLEAEDGTALIERVKAEQPELILLDLQLPAVDGLTLARQLKADPATQGIPVLVTTAYAQVGNRELVLAAGCSGFLAKPIDVRAFVQTVGHLLGQSSTAWAGSHAH
jgi:two-component system cell cycle response regulator DivK